MTVIFDLDDTLLDTSRFKRDMALTSAEEVVERAADYVFPDAVALLEALRIEGWTLVLLTYGRREWQSRKVAKSGLERHFDRVICTSEPKTALAEEIGRMSAPIVMVNDNGTEIDALQARLPEARMIAIRAEKPLPSDPNVPVCTTIGDVMNSIMKM